MYHHEKEKNYFRIFFQPIAHEPYEEVAETSEYLTH